MFTNSYVYKQVYLQTVIFTNSYIYKQLYLQTVVFIYSYYLIIIHLSIHFIGLCNGNHF